MEEKELYINFDEYIRQGDIIQVVPSQKFTAEEKVDPVNVYRALRLINPSPYLFFLIT